ncbi:hydroxyacid dehydrogenase, partial [Priestia megaterium]
VNRIINEAEQLISQGQTVAVYTRRERLDLGEGKKEEELKLSVKISDAVTSIVRRLNVRPNFIVAKGGITSSDIGVNGLSVKRATVAGQIKPGIPVWVTGEESKFPGIAYIIFPGNVGAKTTLRETVELLSK